MTARRRPTRDEAITAAAEIYLEEKIRLETERLIAAAKEEAPDAGQGIEGQETPKGSS